MTELLERAEALKTLQQLLQEARTRGRVALVAGEAGIGKSTLLEATAAAHGTVWWGRCDALETPLPLAPWLDIARERGPRFAGLLPGPRPMLFAAVLDELRAAATPVLVVIEDAHWADDATLDLLKFLGRRIEGARAVLAISFRDDEVTAAHPLRRLIGELPAAAVKRVDLQRLSEAAVEALARQAQRPAEGLFAATRGNPFFVTEVLRHAGTTVPGTVQDLVLARYARLRGPAQAILRFVALVPARIERWLLEALLTPAAEDLEACADAGLLQGDGATLQFRHELARVAIESSLSPPLAQALHAQVLAALVASGQNGARGPAGAPCRPRRRRGRRGPLRAGGGRGGGGARLAPRGGAALAGRAALHRRRRRPTRSACPGSRPTPMPAASSAGRTTRSALAASSTPRTSAPATCAGRP